MGGTVSVALPVMDKRGQKAVKLAGLTDPDLALFFQVFKRIDKELLGKIFVDDMFEYLDEPRSIFSDAIFELNETPLNRGMLSFGDFVQTLVTYCLFEREEIQRFIYFIFDKDKNGYIRVEDLEMYVKLINAVDFDEGFHANLAVGWDKLQKEFNKDGKVDFREFSVFNSEWPAMFFPAYRLQEKMIERSLGRKWWDAKKRGMQAVKDAAKEAEQKKEQAEKERVERVRQRKIRKKMGCWTYYFCPCLRERWDSMFPPPEEKNEATEKEKRAAARRAKQEEAVAEVNRQKNAPTLEYENFKVRKARIQENWAANNIKPKRIHQERRARAENRHSRWKAKFDV